MKNTKNLASVALWVDTDNGLYKLADCDAMIEVSEKPQTLKLSGSETEYTVKAFSAALVICSGIKLGAGRDVDVNFLKSVKRFDLKFQPVETLVKHCRIFVNEFDDIIPLEIDLNGDWRFDITAHFETIKGLFPNLVFCNCKE